MRIMQIRKLRFFRKNKKFFRLNRLYLELLKTKHLLNFFLAGLKKKQLLHLYSTISKKRFFWNFLSLLEQRLDFILLKSNFTVTGKQAKQFIVHGHVKVNNQSICTPSYLVKEFDLISLDMSVKHSLKCDLIKRLLKTPLFFSFLRRKKFIFKKTTMSQLFIYFKFSLFLEINFRTFTILVLKKPQSQELFLSKTASLYDYNQLQFVL